MRDYIHIEDLAQVHIKAIDLLINPGYKVYNVGSGKGYSVMEVIQCY